MSQTARQILQGKTTETLSVDPGLSVFDALTIMAKHDVGSVLVMSGQALLGIFTERDYARKVALQGRSSRATAVAELMSQEVLTIAPMRTVEECMAIMTEKRVRHLPVVENDSVIGIVSIGDVVKTLIAEQQTTIKHLHGYIAGELDTESSPARPPW
ncbi:CBS domain-containing protein [Niveibacterium terrae]|uniref:CBS domain-containing protein n=1 Tax=Niveibacterium terrae TaxID=3373598 RepID=UPI003A94ECC9